MKINYSKFGEIMVDKIFKKIGVKDTNNISNDNIKELADEALTNSQINKEEYDLIESYFSGGANMDDEEKVEGIITTSLLSGDIDKFITDVKQMGLDEKDFISMELFGDKKIGPLVSKATSGNASDIKDLQDYIKSISVSFSEDKPVTEVSVINEKVDNLTAIVEELSNSVKTLMAKELTTDGLDTFTEPVQFSNVRTATDYINQITKEIPNKKDVFLLVNAMKSGVQNSIDYFTDKLSSSVKDIASFQNALATAYSIENFSSKLNNYSRKYNFSQIDGNSSAFKAGAALAESETGLDRDALNAKGSEAGYEGDDLTNFKFGYNSKDKKAENFSDIDSIKVGDIVSEINWQGQFKKGDKLTVKSVKDGKAVVVSSDGKLELEDDISNLTKTENFSQDDIFTVYDIKTKLRKVDSLGKPVEFKKLAEAKKWAEDNGGEVASLLFYVDRIQPKMHKEFSNLASTEVHNMEGENQVIEDLVAEDLAAGIKDGSEDFSAACTLYSKKYGVDFSQKYKKVFSERYKKENFSEDTDEKFNLITEVLGKVVSNIEALRADLDKILNKDDSDSQSVNEEFAVSKYPETLDGDAGRYMMKNRKETEEYIKSGKLKKGDVLYKAGYMYDTPETIQITEVYSGKLKDREGHEGPNVDFVFLNSVDQDELRMPYSNKESIKNTGYMAIEDDANQYFLMKPEFGTMMTKKTEEDIKKHKDRRNFAKGSTENENMSEVPMPTIQTWNNYGYNKKSDDLLEVTVGGKKYEVKGKDKVTKFIDAYWDAKNSANMSEETFVAISTKTGKKVFTGTKKECDDWLLAVYGPENVSSAPYVIKPESSYNKENFAEPTSTEDKSKAWYDGNSTAKTDGSTEDVDARAEELAGTFGYEKGSEEFTDFIAGFKEGVKDASNTSEEPESEPSSENFSQDEIQTRYIALKGMFSSNDF